MVVLAPERRGRYPDSVARGQTTAGPRCSPRTKLGGRLKTKRTGREGMVYLALSWPRKFPGTRPRQAQSRCFEIPRLPQRKA